MLQKVTVYLLNHQKSHTAVAVSRFSRELAPHTIKPSPLELASAFTRLDARSARIWGNDNDHDKALCFSLLVLDPVGRSTGLQQSHGIWRLPELAGEKAGDLGDLKASCHLASSKGSVLSVAPTCHLTCIHHHRELCVIQIAGVRSTWCWKLFRNIPSS